jgi:hypothetical protein
MRPAPAPSSSPAIARLLRVVAACCLALWLAGCGVSLLYPRLDSIVGFYFEDLVRLDDAQSELLSRTLSANLEWHRRSELGRYAGFLRGLAGSVETGVDAAEWREATRQTEEYWRDIFEQAAPGYIAIAATLTDTQVAELLQNLEARDEKTWREFAERTPDERRARREKSIVRALERFTGKLTPSQRTMIREYAARGRPFMAEWRENRRAWREALAEALADRRSGERFAARMTQLIARPDDLWTPQYRAALDASRSALVDLLADLDGTLSETQRRAASRELLALADEFQGLAGSRG